jgi:hypothetical protein
MQKIIFRTTITLSESHKAYVENKFMNLSSFVRAQLDNLILEEKELYKKSHHRRNKK